MLHVLDCIVFEHDLRFVAIAALVCAFASWTALGMIRWALRASGINQKIWLMAAATVFGSGVWATHFVGILAHHTALIVGFDTVVSLASFFLAIALSAVAFTLAANPRRKLIGALMLGIAICTMHFVGMAALQGPFISVWDVGYVAASLTFGIVGAVTACWAAFAFRSYRGISIATGALTVAVCGVHFVGMSAVTLVAVGQPAEGVLFERGWLAIAVAASATLLVTIGFTSAITKGLLQSRAAKETARLHAHVNALEDSRRELQRKSAELQLALNDAAAADVAKTQFLAAMSHELRTPLNAIIGFSEIMGMEASGPIGNATYAGYIVDIKECGTNLLRLINDILDLTRLEAARMVLDEGYFDASDLMADVADRMASRAQSGGVHLTISPRQACQLFADRRRVGQILFNLVSNAVKFTPVGGQVCIESTVENGAFVVRVQDTGIGMDSADIPKALDRFGQIDGRLSRKYDGAGLGLPLALRFVKLHGGTLSMESAVGRGTVVTVAFPLHRLNVAAQAA